MTESDQSAEAIAASQQVGDELPSGIRRSGAVGDDMDNPSPSGALDPDQPNPINTAAGVSMGGTGAGIEPGVDAELAGVEDVPEALAADVYGEPEADDDWGRAGDEDA